VILKKGVASRSALFIFWALNETLSAAHVVIPFSAGSVTLTFGD
jgi:hypothetical protein